MTSAWLRSCALALMLGSAAPGMAVAADPVKLLARMHKAAHSLDYDGTFVYQRGDQLESLRILHRSGNGGMRERLVSLTGAPREIIRTDSEVRCYLPDENAVMIEHRRADRRNFPAFLPDSISSLSSYYILKRGRDGRVAGHRVQSVTILPRDSYRYGYQLWADKATGLLLKASVLDEQGAVIEQYMFTQITIGRPISESDLKAQHPDQAQVVLNSADDVSSASVAQWRAERLPAGFALTARMLRKLPTPHQPVEHLVYSDGLGVVSVFIEPASADNRNPVLSGVSQMGAVHVFGKQIEEHQVTAIGEVPARTVGMIGESVGRTQ